MNTNQYIGGIHKWSLSVFYFVVVESHLAMLLENNPDVISDYRVMWQLDTHAKYLTSARTIHQHSNYTMYKNLGQFWYVPVLPELLILVRLRYGRLFKQFRTLLVRTVICLIRTLTLLMLWLMIDENTQAFEKRFKMVNVPTSKLTSKKKTTLWPFSTADLARINERNMYIIELYKSGCVACLNKWEIHSAKSTAAEVIF